MPNKLGTVEITGEMQADMKRFAVLEGTRRTEKLIDDATTAYLKVITTAFSSALTDERKGTKQLAVASAKP